jgi:thiopeptide-type bacteriocin biosynthesis protein
MWRSIHIHYADQQDRLITGGIGPLIASARASGLSQWFFLRYWKGGLHVRLRARFETDEPAPWHALVAGLHDYLQTTPSAVQLDLAALERSHRMLAALEGESTDTVVIHPNNTAVIHPYEPEPRKYGGSAGVALAETVFDASSDAVVAALSAIAGTPVSRLGIALTMMLAGLRAAGHDEPALGAWLEEYSRFCERFAQPEAWRSWLAKLAQRPELLRQFSAAPPSPARTPAWMQRWVEAFAAAVRALREHAAVVRPAVTMARTIDPLQFVLFNYVHTHNNRLGLAPMQEAQIAYLGCHLVRREGPVEKEARRA